MKKTQTTKCLEALERSGSQGIHSFHLNLILGTTRSAARISDLKDQGYVITTKHERIGNCLGVRYFLSSQPKKQLKWVFEGNTAYQVEI